MFKKVLFFSLLTFLIINYAFSQKKGFKSTGTNYDLVYYRLELDVDPAVRYITGDVTIYFKTIESSVNQVVFDLNNDLTIDNIEFHGSNLTYTHNSDIITATLPSTLSSNHLDSLTINYHGTPPTGGGFGAFIIDTHGSSNTPAMWTLSEPYGAKEWFPCKQTLSDKADSVDIVITHPEAYKAASNGLLISETTAAGKTTAYWKHKRSIATYLIAFAVTNYSIYSDYVPLDGGNNIEVLNYVYPEDLSYAQSSTPKTIKIMQLYNNLFIDYPYKDEKYGHAQFGWGGGMEHQTMSFMNNFGFSLIAHELAHQWFGDYITCSSWKNIWINEGFATYCEGLCVENGLTSDNWESWKQNKVSYITGQTGGSVYVDDTTSVERIFNGRLSYAKGAMVLHMLRKQIGDDNFFNSLKNYLSDNQLINSFASTENLKAHFEAISGENLDEYFNDWIYGEGYPVYKINWWQDEDYKGFINIEQTQSHNSVDFFDLKVPIQFIGNSKDTILFFNNTYSGQEFTFELDFEVNTINFDPKTYLISKNAQILTIDSFKNFDLLLFPLPAHDSINIRFKNSKTFSNVSIYNLNGKKIKSFGKTESKKQFQYDISSLEKGLYFIKLKSKEKNYKKKFLKI